MTMAGESFPKKHILVVAKTVQEARDVKCSKVESKS